MTVEDENKFAFYIDREIQNLRYSEGWSDGKISFHLRRIAQELSPKVGRPKKIVIPKEVIEAFVKQEKQDG